MAGNTPPTFTGSAQDYLNWFRMDIEQPRVIIPNSQTGGEGLPPEEDDSQLPPVPDYLRHDLGRTYVREFQDQLLQEYEISRDNESSVISRQDPPLDLEEDTVTETIPDAEEDDLIQKTHVYLHYDFSKRNSNSQLPVFNYRKEILETIANYQVIVIEGETGCGKSTQVPQFILDEAAAELRYCNIVVTQPRKIAATSLARRVCLERDWKLGKLVGYQVGLDNCSDPDTRLAFVTTEILVQKLIHKRSLGAYTHIILDEVHERDQHTDFALLLVKKLLHTVSRDVKVILMSATIDAFKFAQYFSTPVMGHLIPSPIVSIGTTRVHKIQIFYMESLSIICKERPAVLPQLPTVCIEEPGIAEDMYKLVMEMIKCFDNMERQEEGILSSTKFSQKRGAVLVFLPGFLEIERLIGCLDKGKFKYQWQIYPLHSSITQEEQQRVFYPSHKGFRKIILSTNIAESSITVPDIKYVIDFCLTKILTCDTVTNYTSLKLAWASKASCKQRAGRTGRVSSGRVYRLVPKSFYEILPAYATPELCRTPLSQVVLKAKILNMGEPRALLALALDPPNLADIHHTILSLKQMGALTMKAGGRTSSLDGDLTFLGNVMAALPLDPHLAKLIVMGYIFGCLRECVIIAAGLSLKSIHAKPFHDELNAFLSKVSWAFGSFSDCLAILNAYDLWHSMQNSGAFLRPGAKQEEEWAKHCYIQLGAIKEVHTLVQELQNRLTRVKIHVFNCQSVPRNDLFLLLKICMAGAFYPHYYKRSIPDDYEKEVNRELGGKDPFCTVVVGGLPADTNLLYDDQLRVLFKDCSRNLLITYEGTRAYIQFQRTRNTSKKEELFQDIPGEFPTSMHLALKMRQIPRIQQELVLKLYSQEEARSKMAEILGVQRKNRNPVTGESRIMKSLGKNRFTATQSLDTSLRPPILPSPINHVWRIHVTHVETAGRFWAISNEAHEIGNLYEIQSYIESSVKRGVAPYLDPEEVRPGQICLALYKDSEEMGRYYRVRVEELKIEEGCEIQALVYFVDYGNIALVKAAELRNAPESVLKLEMLAIECMLSEIKPLSKSTSAIWDERATMWMKKYVQNSDFIAQIYSVVHGVVRVKLLNKDMVGMESINEKLIEMGYAVKAQEFYLSKQNHELRAIYSRDCESYDDESSLVQSSSMLSLSSKGLQYSHGKVRLRGPETPLLLRFVSLSRAGSSKGVRIDSTSVNSTALDLEPQSKHDRFLVASFVSLNPCETEVTLRNTTLMPSIPGLMAKCLMMFCPTAELRVSKDGTRYVGAIIGLGFDPETGHAIYPDEDIEATFDVEFSQEDLMMINKVRFHMNVVLDEGEFLTAKRLVEIQKRLQELISVSMDAKREYQDPEAFLKAYRWNMVSVEDKLCVDTGNIFSDSFSVVFPLINGIALRTDSTNNQLRDALCELKNLEKKLSLEGAAPSTVIEIECKLCEVFLKTFSDLRCHLACNSHFSKELKLMK